jgi:hypothetical protein
MMNKEDSSKIVNIIKDYKSSSNSELTFVMDFIQEDFTKTKESLFKLTEHLDKLESTYNLIITEYQKRKNNT